MKYFNTGILWLLAVLFILTGLVSIFTEFFVGLLFLLAGALCIPSARDKISGYIKRPYTSKHNAFAVVAVILVAGVLIGNSQDGKAQAQGFADGNEMVAAQKKGAKTKAEYDQILAAETAAQAKATAEEAKAKAEQEKATQVAKEEADANCRKDLQCWAEKHFSSASVYCPQQIERLAKYDVKWTDGMLEPKLSRYKWKSKDKGIVSYIGDKIQFQNGFGAFQNHIYVCDVDTTTDQVVSVDAMPGRL